MSMLASRTSTLNKSVTLFELKQEEVDEPTSPRNEHGVLEPSSSNRMCGSTILRRRNLVRNLAESESEEEARPTKRTKRALKHEPSPSKISDTTRSEPKRPSKTRATSSSSKRKPRASETEYRKPRRTVTTGSAGPSSGAAHPEPPKWRQAYDLIHEMRYTPSGKARDAAVDTMGCNLAGECEGEDKNRRFSILISLMLSSQTKDVVVHAAISSLRSALCALGSSGLSAAALASASQSLIQECINKVGFWRKKTEYIQKVAIICRDEYDGDVPQTLQELLDLPGVGKKMAFLLLGSGWGFNVGIGVDVHVHRITNRLGWHDPPTKTPEETRVNLESWLPRELHQKINHLLVGFGQTICNPVKPKCSECSLSDIEGLCPSVQLPSPSTSPRKHSTKRVKISATKRLSRSQSIETSPVLAVTSDVKNEPIVHSTAATTMTTRASSAAKIYWEEETAHGRADDDEEEYGGEEFIKSDASRRRKAGKQGRESDILKVNMEEGHSVIGGPKVEIKIEE
ncbi:DNA glycosylase [Lentinula raphanica]|nr:DNA glycosylase [Lentinula raphanica]